MPLPQAPAQPLPEVPAAQTSAVQAPDVVHRIESQRLFAGAQEVQIEHHGVVYRLKQTSLGKLILTK